MGVNTGTMGANTSTVGANTCTVGAAGTAVDAAVGPLLELRPPVCGSSHKKVAASSACVGHHNCTSPVAGSGAQLTEGQRRQGSLAAGHGLHCQSGCGQNFSGRPHGTAIGSCQATPFGPTKYT